tara:strand:+ start:1038 stop:1472 length:435 start_codon:yes stop_codon:yes gene_type:complete
MKSTITLSAALIVAGLAVVLWPEQDQEARASADAPSTGAPLADVILPDTLSQNAQIGQRAYEVNCAACHGANAAGQEGVAPPLVHKIYEPGHHGDESFQRAAAMGVQAHHWRFGDMPPVEGITRADVSFIIAYIRELQRANGIN